MDLREEITACISKVSKVPKEELSPDTEIFNSNIVTSLGLLEIISFIEKQYNVVILSEELINENFYNINRIVEFINQKIGE